ncbi:MAG: DNA-binding protein, partial [Sodalis sp. (in: enterobacteria)]
RERLRLALTSGLLVTGLDALLFFGVQRLASDIAALRKNGLKIDLLHVEAFDSQTQQLREIPAYRLISNNAVAVAGSLAA